MRLLREAVLKDTAAYLEETSELPWGTAHVILMQAQDLIEKQHSQLVHLEKMVVWYQDITMTGTHSEEYEKGFWDAVDFVRWHQLGAYSLGHN